MTQTKEEKKPKFKEGEYVYMVDDDLTILRVLILEDRSNKYPNTSNPIYNIEAIWGHSQRDEYELFSSPQEILEKIQSEVLKFNK